MRRNGACRLLSCRTWTPEDRLSEQLLGARVLQARHAAFLRSMHQHGLKTSPAAIGCSYYLSECMEKHLPRFLENGITAIICNQDTLASATLTQCQQLGFQIPDDISIIGFDDLPIAACTSPPLTTIRQDRLELGKSGFLHCQVFSIASRSVRICCMHS